MESDVKSFDQVSDSLNLGSATVGVARSGAEAITERLQEAKALIVAANDPSVSDSDREKYQTDITELTASVQSIVDSASSNGQNLLKGVGSIDILSSLNRQSDGTVEAGKVNVARQNLSTSAAVAGDAVTTGNAGFVSESGFTLADGSGTPTTDDFTIAAGNVAEDTLFSISIGDDTITYEAAAGTSAVDAGEGFAQAINDYLGGSDGTPPAGLTVAATDAAGVSTLTFTNTNATPVVVSDIASATNAEPEGGLYALSQIDVGTVAGAEAGLEAIDNLLQILFLDLVNPNNTLPQELKTSLIQLSDFTMSHSRKVLLGEASPEALIDINSSVIAGLRQSMTPGSSAAKTKLAEVA